MNIKNINHKKKHITIISILLLVSMLTSITVSAEESEPSQNPPMETESKVQSPEPDSPVIDESIPESNENIEPEPSLPEDTSSEVAEDIILPGETAVPETTEPETSTEIIPEPETESEPETQTENSVLDSETADLLKQYLEKSVSNNDIGENPSEEPTILPDENMEKVLVFLEEYKTCWTDLSHDMKYLTQTHLAIGCTVTIGIGILVGLLIFRRWH